MEKLRDKGPATLRATSAERRRSVCMPLSQLFHWLTLSRACSKDAVADEMAVSDAYVPQANVYILFKAKAGDAEDVFSPKEKTLAQGPLPLILLNDRRQKSLNSGKRHGLVKPRKRGRTMQMVL